MENKGNKFNLQNIDIDFFESEEDIEEIEVDENGELFNRVKNYLDLDYPIKLIKDQDEKGPYWLAEHPDLPGCRAHGNTKEEALKSLEEAKISWMYSYADLGKEIPEPNQLKEVENCSGKILVRLPKELHYQLINKAKADGISLNQEILYLLSSSFGASQSDNYLSQIFEKLNSLQTQNEKYTNEDKYSYALSNIVDVFGSIRKPQKIKDTTFEDILTESFERIEKGKNRQSDLLDYGKLTSNKTEDMYKWN